MTAIADLEGTVLRGDIDKGCIRRDELGGQQLAIVREFYRSIGMPILVNAAFCRRIRGELGAVHILNENSPDNGKNIGAAVEGGLIQWRLKRQHFKQWGRQRKRLNLLLSQAI